MLKFVPVVHAVECKAPLSRLIFTKFIKNTHHRSELNPSDVVSHVYYFIIPDFLHIFLFFCLKLELLLFVAFGRCVVTTCFDSVFTITEHLLISRPSAAPGRLNQRSLEVIKCVLPSSSPQSASYLLFSTSFLLLTPSHREERMNPVVIVVKNEH